MSQNGTLSWLRKGMTAIQQASMLSGKESVVKVDAANVHGKPTESFYGFHPAATTASPS